ncbi:MFS transporter [Pinibacter aurantiacus]|uniref:MFS transporter n=1 Tax=Pinibacter aurantiacus TaxID=2851599 RepID=A0A9E2SB88_9BACT|nr:MFS transporter [Pinibacter aurantiacus]MBV4358224.1 MFS transporter [Pinibacter aurantiacus]
MPNNTNISKVLPILFTFLIMGFVDVVGISANYVKQDFQLTDKIANILPFMVFLWFAVFSIPTSILMNKIGRKATVLISLAITIVALFCPLIAYNYPMMLLSFALLGIGNSIVQVSLNPLLAGVVSGKNLSSTLTLGQFIKAIASFLGPIVAIKAVSIWGDWKYIFPVFGATTILAGIWILLTPVKKETTQVATSTFGDCFGLLSDKAILVLFLGILLLVGVDVGLNISIPRILMEKCNLPLDEAAKGNSVYFAARTIGSLAGSFLLSKLSERKFLGMTMLAAVATLLLFLFVHDLKVLQVLIFILGLCIANVFSIIFSAAIKTEPTKANEISGLMIMGVAGGAILPLISGYAADVFNTQNGAIFVILVGVLYLLFCSVKIKSEPVK